MHFLKPLAVLICSFIVSSATIFAQVPLQAASYFGSPLENPTVVDLVEILQLNTGASPYYRTFPIWLDWNSDNQISMIDGLMVLEALENPVQPPALPGNYTLLAWNDLGMHCVDGNDYSIFSILPPFNNLHAQLINKSDGLVSSGVHITFESALSLSGSWNTRSVPKTNFWDYAEPLYSFLYGGGALPADQGLTGIFAQSRYPQELSFDAGNQWWAADGIPILPYNDDGTKEYYQLVTVKAFAQGGQVLAKATAVLPVSDEMDCRKCHGSASNYQAAKPTSGWADNEDPDKDYKLNILSLHDENESTSLMAEAMGGTPVLCAECHLSNALPGTGSGGISQLTIAIHSRHALVIDPDTNQPLDDDTNRTACYSCHPGQQTKCLRGAMGGVGVINCQDCHGAMSDVGAQGRQGWLDEPTCQQCHQNGSRYPSVFDSQGNLRPVTDQRFATTMDVPVAGKDLYRFSTGHHGVQCEGCHGATHAIYPSIDPEDNILATEIQGHAGTIAECTSCHNATPQTVKGGPHGLHAIGQSWVNRHKEDSGSVTANCAPCHGSDFQGSQLSKTFSERTFSTEWGTKTFPAGHQIGCYDCHNGPNID